jgi:hypothetical protein
MASVDARDHRQCLSFVDHEKQLHKSVVEHVKRNITRMNGSPELEARRA